MAFASIVMKQRAEQLVKQSSTWHTGRDKQDGTGFYLIPGTEEGTAWYANRFGCNCPSYRNRAACSHHEACKILDRQGWARRLSAAQVKPSVKLVRTYDQLFGED